MAEGDDRVVPTALAAPPAQMTPPPWWVQPPPKSGFRKFLRILFISLFVLSIIVNIELTMILFRGPVEKLDSTVVEDGDKTNIVALYQVNGMIDQKAAVGLAKFYQVVRDNPAIKAVVIRVDSGGGGVGASDEMHYMIKNMREKLKKPVVVSMGSVAASGGYYISAPADEIFAEPSTITGSIGVIAAWPVLKDTMDKIGVQMITVRSSEAREWKARENYWEVPDERTMKNLQDMLDKMQERFEQVVRDGRGDKIKLGPVEVAKAPATAPSTAPAEAAAKPPGRAPFNGQVFLAAEALNNGLVDKVGYLSDAIAAATAKAGLTKPCVLDYHRRTGLLAAIFGGDTEETPVGAKLLDELTSPRVMMLWKP